MIRILSVNTIVPMAVVYKNELDETISLSVDVDYLNGKVYFPQDKYNEELEKAIIDEIRPVEIATVEIPPEYMQRINKAKSGHYKEGYKNEG